MLDERRLPFQVLRLHTPYRKQLHDASAAFLSAFS